MNYGFPVPKLKKRRKNTSAREVADMSEVNGEGMRHVKRVIIF